MPDSDTPFVAVVGGFWGAPAATAANAQAAAREIGKELAKSGFGLVTYYSHPNSLEPYVVEGFASACADTSGLIKIRFTNLQADAIKFKEQDTKRQLFVSQPFAGNDWEAPFYRSLSEDRGVDAVLLVAGGQSTLIAGHIAIARNLPLLAVGAFGGSAHKIWNELAHKSHDNSLPAWTIDSTAALTQNLRKECEKAAERRAAALAMQKLYASATGRSRQLLFCALAFIALVLTVFLGISKLLTPAWYPLVLFGGLIPAGAAGATVLHLFWPDPNNDIRQSFLLGCFAGFVVGLAYPVPQLMSSQGVFGDALTEVGRDARIQFLSSVLIAISAGVGFDTILTRLRANATDLPTLPPP